MNVQDCAESAPRGALLTECAQEWSLTDAGAGHEFIVLLPGSARGIPTHA